MGKAAIHLLAVSFLTSPLLPGQEVAPELPVHEIRVTAKKYEYQPNEIRVKQGERVRLLLMALDRKHGFELKEWGIKTELQKGEETTVEFVASRPGEYQFKCSVFCGLGHGRVKGKLLVEPAGQ